jgi:hypothetical protein
MAPASLTHLFEVITRSDCPPCDLRRAFGTIYAQVADLELAQIKSILGGVTNEHYASLNGAHKRWPPVRRWCAWVDPAAEREPVQPFCCKMVSVLQIRGKFPILPSVCSILYVTVVFRP